MLFRRAKEEAYATLRRHMIRETEAALLYGILFPDRVPRIPTVEVSRATGDAGLKRAAPAFDPQFSEKWWELVLAGDASVLPRQLGAGRRSRY